MNQQKEVFSISTPTTEFSHKILKTYFEIYLRKFGPFSLMLNVQCLVHLPSWVEGYQLLLNVQCPVHLPSLVEHRILVTNHKRTKKKKKKKRNNNAMIMQC
jgi:hypothetical protein